MRPEAAASSSAARGPRAPRLSTTAAAPARSAPRSTSIASDEAASTPTASRISPDAAQVSSSRSSPGSYSATSATGTPEPAWRHGDVQHAGGDQTLKDLLQRRPTVGPLFAFLCCHTSIMVGRRGGTGFVEHRQPSGTPGAGVRRR
ncbi:hypothetical protein STENM327S_01698 [Streptomyces tendae]